MTTVKEKAFVCSGYAVNNLCTPYISSVEVTSGLVFQSLSVQTNSIKQTSARSKLPYPSTILRDTTQRYPKKMLQYQPGVKRRLGKPLKRILDDIQLEAETDHSGLNS
jgi:hypothetical protein